MNQAVILSEAKDHLENIERRKMILRCAQDDKPFRTSTPRAPSKASKYTLAL